MNTATLSTSIESVNKEQFIKQFTPLVKRIACHMMAKLPTSVLMDDLIRAGMDGLMEAIKRYKGSYDQQFEIFAANRIRSSILNQLRASD
jgi:RNA polymerase sigma factor for flagellar operon FliA